MSLDENLKIFLSESEELLEEMEQALLSMEQCSDDDELINQIFRAAHTIKGSAGLFGYTTIIAFTHVVENLLDDIRNSLIPVNKTLITLLMQCKDHMQVLVSDLNEHPQGLGEEEYPDQAPLIDMLNAYQVTQDNLSVVKEEDKPVNEPQTLSNNEHRAKTQNYHISIRMSENTFKEGFDPTMMFSQLDDIGTIKKSRLITSAIPELSELDSENCYLGWELSFVSAESKQTISEIFEWYEDSKIRILPPKSTINEFKKLLEELPEEDISLGQILLEVGTLSQDELQQALIKQRDTGELTGDILVEEGSVQPEVIKMALEKQQKVRRIKHKEQDFIRVSSEKLDQLVSLVGELVMSGAKLSQLSTDSGNIDLIESVDEMTSTLESMRETAL